VVLDGVSSKVNYIICSVPQRSVLGPVFFILYVADLADIVAEHNMSLHAYADNNQLYIHCQPEDAQSVVLSVQQCVSVIDNSAATFVQAFVASRVDYCGSLLIGAPKKTTDKLQRVLNAAARIVSNTRKYDRGLSQFRRRELH